MTISNLNQVNETYNSKCMLWCWIVFGVSL